MSQPPDNIDYARTANVARMHAAAARESGDPAARSTPISLGIIAAIVAIGMTAGSYFGANKGDLSSANVKGFGYSPKFSGVHAGSAEMSPQEKHKPENWRALGKGKYAQCQGCHQPTGEGIPGQYPPLKGSEWVTGGHKRLVAILQHGVNGPLKVAGKGYNGQMQPLGGPMSDTDLAQLLSYIRNEWGNKAGDIYEDQVKALRKELGDRSPYAEPELLAIPADANAPESEWIKKLAAPAGGAAPAAATPAPAPAAK